MTVSTLYHWSLVCATLVLDVVQLLHTAKTTRDAREVLKAELEVLLKSQKQL